MVKINKQHPKDAKQRRIDFLRAVFELDAAYVAMLFTMNDHRDGAVTWERLSKAVAAVVRPIMQDIAERAP